MFALGACADYAKHGDTITASAGDALAHNKVVHTADPWPRASGDNRITDNGQRVDKVTKRYLNGPASSSASTSAASQTSNSPDSAGSPPAQ
jgi:hypothetical protein